MKDTDAHKLNAQTKVDCKKMQLHIFQLTKPFESQILRNAIFLKLHKTLVRLTKLPQMLSQLVKHSCLNKEFHIVKMLRLCEFPACIAA